MTRRTPQKTHLKVGQKMHKRKKLILLRWLETIWAHMFASFHKFLLPRKILCLSNLQPTKFKLEIF